MELRAIRAGVKQRDENAKSNERDMNVDPEEQTEDRGREDEQNDEPDNHEPLKIDEQDEKVSAMKENILRKFETAKETPIDQRLPNPKIKSDRHSKSAIETANKAINQIKDELPEALSGLTDINHLFYKAASAITESLGIKQKRRNILHVRKVNQPKWKKRIENDICKIRRDIFIQQGWRSGESARLPPMCPGFNSQTRCHMWAEFVGSLLCSERFF